MTYSPFIIHALFTYYVPIHLSLVYSAVSWYDFTLHKDAFSEFRMFREAHGLAVTRPLICTSTLDALRGFGWLKELHILERTVLVTDSTDSTITTALLPKALETLKLARDGRECAEWALHARRENKHGYAQKDPNTLITLTHH
ncbi:uncharacterized protein NEPG_02563 [Nematocida parisii ERTm1]|nr:uncharacterized protein NEPG_02563 [Nematocida parisii ERTm1]EIJ92549.1 hypothetical protein NEPG_02563 [Nematocida parisii ERTm1]|eukprot:XP_013060390.1 hypothetical protein NEPG_02563 [Nematocida parisii ERTm1]